MRNQPESRAKPRKPRWVVYYFGNAKWNKDSDFFSARAAADYAGRVFGTSFRWKIERRRVKQQYRPT
jgi:hypothetical protein